VLKLNNESCLIKFIVVVVVAVVGVVVAFLSHHISKGVFILSDGYYLSLSSSKLACVGS